MTTPDAPPISAATPWVRHRSKSGGMEYVKSGSNGWVVVHHRNPAQGGFRTGWTYWSNLHSDEGETRYPTAKSLMAHVDANVEQWVMSTEDPCGDPECWRYLHSRRLCCDHPQMTDPDPFGRCSCPDCGLEYTVENYPDGV